jgi:hypothetical protein
VAIEVRADAEQSVTVCVAIDPALVVPCLQAVDASFRPPTFPGGGDG